MASAEQVITLRSDGGCIGLEVDPTGVSMASAEQVMSLRSAGGCIRLVLPYAGAAADPCFQVLPVAPPLGSICPRHFCLDVGQEVFEHEGSEIVFDNSVNQLFPKAPGGI